MNWDDVRYFLAVADAGSLAAAGRSLGVKHTTIARRVSQLEEDLGVVLIQRTPEGVKLTPAGARAAGHARFAARAMSELGCAVRGVDEEVAGVVRLAVSEAFGGFVSRRLAPLQALHPQLRVHILVANRAHDVARGEADVALRLMDKPDNPDLRIRLLAELGWSLYAARGYLVDAAPIADIDSLREHALIGFEDSMSRVDGAVWLREQDLSSHVVLRTNSIPSALNATISGLGIAPLPCFLGEDESSLVRVLNISLSRRKLYMVCHPDVAQAGRVRAVIDYLVELVSRERELLLGPADDTVPPAKDSAPR